MTSSFLTCYLIAGLQQLCGHSIVDVEVEVGVAIFREDDIGDDQPIVFVPVANIEECFSK